MRKAKLILGTYNSQPPEEVHLAVEDYYQNAYKTFLTTLYNEPAIKLSLFYSGSLFEWIEEKHSEFLSVLQEMINNKQVELLGGGFYSPALTLLPIPDRVGQMEKLTTYIRKNFSKKPRGCYLSENVWDSSLVSNLKSCGFDYVFLDDNQFKSSGISDDDLIKCVITEDQGKIITVIPINSVLNSMFLRRPPIELINYIQDNIHLDGVFTILFKGEYLKSSLLTVKEIKSWIEEFNSLLLENSSWIETIHPGKYVKQVQGSLQRVFFPQYSINGMRNKPLPIASQKDLNRLNRHLGALGDVSHWINSGFFKQFISRYNDSALLYSKMMYVNLLANQIKGDRSRKKTAREELWKSQSHYVYWHGAHLGIYDRDLRKRTYKFLIDSEISTREKGIFKPGITHFDIDMDGLKEALYQGEYYNSYISLKGGIIFQLDCLKRKNNLLSTVQRVEESYHNSENRVNEFDKYPRKMFHDHFISENLSLDKFSENTYEELGSFVDSNFEFDSLNRESKYVILKASGSVNNNGSCHNLTIQKKYLFNKNGIVLTYNIENNDNLPISTVFAPEMNLALSDVMNGEIPYLSSDKEHFLLNKASISGNISNFVVNDDDSSIKVNISFSNETFKFWTLPQYSNSLADGEIINIYQFSTFLPQWKLKLAPNQVWSLAINLSLS